MAGYCHWQVLQHCSRLSTCLKVCSSPLSYASPWEVAVTKGIFVCMAKLPSGDGRTIIVQSFSPTALFFR